MLFAALVILLKFVNMRSPIFVIIIFICLNAFSDLDTKRTQKCNIRLKRKQICNFAASVHVILFFLIAVRLFIHVLCVNSYADKCLPFKHNFKIGIILHLSQKIGKFPKPFRQNGKNPSGSLPILILTENL